jgi:hypothetical protein
MKLPRPRYVTLTGADDSIKPESLFELSRLYPFVEWGILIGTRSGTRFPSLEWRQALANIHETSGRVMNLSLHLCGKHLSRVTSGRPLEPDSLCHGFQRTQLNFHATKQGPQCAAHINNAFDAMASFPVPWRPEIIFQLDGENNSLVFPSIRNPRLRVVGLVDGSHGAGVLPGSWLRNEGVLGMGYAGGLGPDNLKEQLPKIIEAANGHPYWIDMETSLFRGGVFDLQICTDALEFIETMTERDSRKTPPSPVGAAP